MPYSLGLDLGTTNSAAAIADEQGVRMLSLGHDGAIVPSVVHLRADGEFTVGRQASRRAEADPSGVAREFKRRFGDSTPYLLNGTPIAANDLTLHLAQYFVDGATALEGRPPQQLVVCHPANWGEFKISLLADTLTNSALPPHHLLTEPEAAAIHYAAQERVSGRAGVADGSIIAVYDLGGGTFDVAIMARSGQRWALLGRPGGLERLGGIDFDTAVLHHVLKVLGLDLDRYDDDDDQARAGMARLRAECIEAKHALSADTATTISVLLPGVAEQVRITRAEFEALIDPAIGRSLEAFDTTLASAGCAVDQLDRILMVGGSSRIPLVAARVAGHTGRPLATDAHPKHAMALGAATMALGTATTAPPANLGEPLLDRPLGGMFQELPHISEGLPDFMARNRPPAPTPAPAAFSPTVPPPTATPPPATPPSTAAPPSATLPPAAAPLAGTTQRNPALAGVSPMPGSTAPPQPVGAATGPAQPRPNPTPQPRRPRHGVVMFLIGMVSVLLLASAAAWALGLFDSLTGQDSEETADPPGETDPIIEPEDPDGAEDPPPAASDDGGCPPHEIPDSTLRYQIREISATDQDGGANARVGPSLGHPPATVLPSFTPVTPTGTDCQIDAEGRVWWGLDVEGTLLWVSARLIIPMD